MTAPASSWRTLRRRRPASPQRTAGEAREGCGRDGVCVRQLTLGERCTMQLRLLHLPPAAAASSAPACCSLLPFPACVPKLAFPPVCRRLAVDFVVRQEQLADDLRELLQRLNARRGAGGCCAGGAGVGVSWGDNAWPCGRHLSPGCAACWNRVLGLWLPLQDPPVAANALLTVVHLPPLQACRRWTRGGRWAPRRCGSVARRGAASARRATAGRPCSRAPSAGRAWWPRSSIAPRTSTMRGGTRTAGPASRPISQTTCACSTAAAAAGRRAQGRRRCALQPGLALHASVYSNSPSCDLIAPDSRAEGMGEWGGAAAQIEQRHAAALVCRRHPHDAGRVAGICIDRRSLL